MRKAIICIGSPLQAICALEAITRYKIDFYDMFVIDEGVRLGQIEGFLKDKEIIYSVIPYHVSFWENISRIIGVFNLFKGKYDYLLMGDYRLTGNRMEYIPLVKSRGKIVYLDDGSYIINYAKGLITETKITKIRNYIMNAVCCLKSISYKNLFTVFAKDIVMPGFVIEENYLSQFQITFASKDEDIFFIGTNPLGENGYCPFMGIDFNHYLIIVEKLLASILENNPGSHLIYIPHGRDNTEETKTICSKLNIEYRKLPVCIELFMISRVSYPKEIWGIGSTALYVLKRLYPNTKINNITIEGSNSSSVLQYKELAETYKKNGITNTLIKG